MSKDRSPVLVRLPQEVHDELKRRIAAKWDEVPRVTMNGLLTEIIEKWLEHEKKLEENRATKHKEKGSSK